MKKFTRLVRGSSTKFLLRKKLHWLNDKSNHYVSFTFDDFPESTALNAANVMEKYQVRGTFYTSLGLMDKQLYGKSMFGNDDLLNIYAKGHEIGGHTFYHSDFHTTSSAELKESLKRNKEEIESILPDLTLRSFAYPKGRVTFKGKKMISDRYQSGRTTKSGLNRKGDDLNMLKANKLYSKSCRLKDCFDLIDENKQMGSWLIFYTHDVEDEPSNFGCTKSYFEEVLKYTIGSGATVLPVGDFVLNQCQIARKKSNSLL